MSAIGGVFARCRAGISEDRMRALSRGLRQLGPDGEGIAWRDGVGMVHRPFHVDGQSCLTRQPMVTDDGYMLSFGGRLDNAREIARSLPKDVAAGASDVELVLLAYRRRGLAAFRTLIGDFALALWDPTSHRLLLCCDAMGRYPLYYFCNQDCVWWSSRARPLLDAVPLAAAIDEEHLADYLTNRLPSRGPFKGVDIVPGGHVLVVDMAKTDLVRYWSFDPGREIHYRRDEEYEEHFRDLLYGAVACRLRTVGPVFCELSGGVDSSSIACVADRLLGSATVEASGLHTVSHVHKNAATADETPFIEAVEHQLGRRGIRISEEEYPLLAPWPDSLVCDTPTNRLWAVSRYDHLAEVMMRCGSRVLLNGIGGDQLFWSQYPPGLPLTDLLARGRIAETARRCVEWSRIQHRSVVETFWLGACWPLLPERWRARVQWEGPLGEWFTSGFAKRMQLRERMLPMSDDLGFKLPSSRLQYGYIRRTMRPFALEPCMSSGYIDIRYPYLDRRLIEFALAIPLEQKVRPAESRSIVRRSLVGLVPQDVLQRRTKAGPGEGFLRALVREWPRLADSLSKPRLVELGVVDHHRFSEALGRARHGFVTHETQLLRTISLELWIRNLDVALRGPETPCRPAGGGSVIEGGRYDDPTANVSAA
jgi:asparagine synthase (glutamine-hydrolysing)